MEITKLEFLLFSGRTLQCFFIIHIGIKSHPTTQNTTVILHVYVNFTLSIQIVFSNMYWNITFPSVTNLIKIRYHFRSEDCFVLLIHSSIISFFIHAYAMVDLKRIYFFIYIFVQQHYNILFITDTDLFKVREIYFFERELRSWKYGIVTILISKYI